MPTFWNIIREIKGEFLVLFLTLLAGSIPAFIDVRENGKAAKRKLSTWGKVLIYLFALLLIASAALLYSSKANDMRKEFITKSQRKSDSTAIANMSLQITGLSKSDSSFRLALTKGGYKFENGEIIPPVKYNQSIEKGSGGIQNNAPNQGNQAGRDIVVTTEQHWDDQKVAKFLSDFKKFADENGSKKFFMLMPMGVNKYTKVIDQLRQVLIENGYEDADMYLYRTVFTDAFYSFKMNGNVIEITIHRI